MIIRALRLPAYADGMTGRLKRQLPGLYKERLFLHLKPFFLCKASIIYLCILYTTVCIFYHIDSREILQGCLQDALLYLPL